MSRRAPRTGTVLAASLGYHPPMDRRGILTARPRRIDRAGRRGDRGPGHRPRDAGAFDPTRFFAFFTILSNLIGVAAFAWLVVRGGIDPGPAGSSSCAAPRSST